LPCYPTSSHKSKFGSAVPMAVTMKGPVLWDVTPCSLVNVYRREVSFLPASCWLFVWLNLRPDDGGSKCHRNVGKLPSDYTVS
jgi:hypothetical protein